MPIFKNKTRKKKTPWWNKALTKEVKKKRDAWKKYVQTKGSEEHTTYIKQRNRTTFKIRKARADFEAKLSEEMKTEPGKLQICEMSFRCEGKGWTPGKGWWSINGK